MRRLRGRALQGKPASLRLLERAQPRDLQQSVDGAPRYPGSERPVGFEDAPDDPELAREFAAEYHREINRLNALREGDHGRRMEEHARVERQVDAIVDAIKDGLRPASMKQELLALEARKQELAAEMKQTPAPAPRLDPKLAELYRERVERLHEELNRPELRAEAAEVLRGLIDEVRLIPENGRLEIELMGALAGILALAADSKQPVTADRDGLQATLVAGTGF